jgi:hypothetical protein
MPRQKVEQGKQNVAFTTSKEAQMDQRIRRLKSDHISGVKTENGYRELGCDNAHHSQFCL